MKYQDYFKLLHFLFLRLLNAPVKLGTINNVNKTETSFTRNALMKLDRLAFIRNLNAQCLKK